MEKIEKGEWELARSNITSWATDLTEAPATKELLTIRDKIYDLSKRIDFLTRPPILEEDPPTPEELVDEGADSDNQEVVEEEEDVEAEEMIVNDTPVRNMILSSFICFTSKPL